MATAKKGQASKPEGKKPEDKKAESKKPGSDKGKTLTIKAVAKGGFYRCGMFFSHEGRTLDADALSEQQVAQLKAEPNLVVSE